MPEFGLALLGTVTFTQASRKDALLMYLLTLDSQPIDFTKAVEILFFDFFFPSNSLFSFFGSLQKISKQNLTQQILHIFLP